MFDWALFEGLETYLKYLTEAGIWLPISTLLCISCMRLTFLTLFVVAAFWTVQYSDHITVCFNNTLDLFVDFQESLQQERERGGKRGRERGQEWGSGWLKPTGNP